MSVCVPEHVARSRFYGAVLDSEEGRFAEAAEKFNAIVQQDAKSPLAAEARLRLGFCKLQSKSYADARSRIDGSLQGG